MTFKSLALYKYCERNPLPTYMTNPYICISLLLKTMYFHWLVYIAWQIITDYWWHGKLP